MSMQLTHADAHPLMGMDMGWLLEQRAQTRRDHAFIVWVPFEGPEQCAVVAKKHAMLDEVPVLFVLPAAHADIDLIECIGAACSAQLADFKRPHEMRIVKAFPRSTLEKIAKAELRRMLEAEQDATRN